MPEPLLVHCWVPPLGRVPLQFKVEPELDELELEPDELEELDEVWPPELEVPELEDVDELDVDELEDEDEELVDDELAVPEVVPLLLVDWEELELPVEPLAPPVEELALLEEPWWLPVVPLLPELLDELAPPELAPEDPELDPPELDPEPSGAGKPPESGEEEHAAIATAVMVSNMGERALMAKGPSFRGSMEGRLADLYFP